MTIQEQKALELALEGGGLYEITGRIEDIDKCIVHRSVIKEALMSMSLRDGLQDGAQQSNEQGCEHCNHSLYCGTKCKNCGKQSNEQVEPVAWRWPYKFKDIGETGAYEYHSHEFACLAHLPKGEPLYTTPPQRTWVGLTDEDKKEYVSQDFGGNRLDAMDWGEKRLKEKNA